MYHKMYIEESIGGSDLKEIQPKHIINCMKAVNDIDISFTNVHSTLECTRAGYRH